MVYYCEYCSYATKRRNDLDRHLNKKNPCYNNNQVLT